MPRDNRSKGRARNGGPLASRPRRRWVITIVVGIAILAAVLRTPIIGSLADVRPPERTGSNMELLVAGMITYATDHGEWPQRLAILPEIYPDDIAPQHLRDPAADNDLPLPHYCYIRPAATADWSDFPILLQNPAGATGSRILVCFADGRRELLRLLKPGDFWRLLQGFAGSTAARAGGVGQEDWRQFWLRAMADELVDQQPWMIPAAPQGADDGEG